jgi:hypothetical protein
MQKIDMGGFKNDIIEVEFAGKTYEIMLDPPIEAYRMFLELAGQKFDKEETINNAKEFIATIISLNNKDVDKTEFKQSLTFNAVSLFITQYNQLLAAVKGGGQKKTEKLQKDMEK